jgi:hypothetical protein
VVHARPQLSRDPLGRAEGEPLRIPVLLLLTTALGCATAQTSRMQEPPVTEEDSQTVSLFPSDAAVLSDEAIAKILDTKVRLPQHVRVALLHIEHRSAGRFWGWGPYWTTIGPSAQQEVAAAVVGVLQGSSRIQHAASLPTFLLPEKATVGHLREAAARFQADIVFVYRTDCQAYERYRFFEANQAKAFCSAESALLDVRSGIVPFTARSLRDFTVDQQNSDAGFLETVRNAEAQAFTAALEENARALVGFLDGRP